MSERPKILLFDLGGVIVRWTGIEALQNLTGLTQAQVKQRLADSAIAARYEVGECSDDEFTAEMIKIYNLDMSAPMFKKLWRIWVGKPYKDIEKALKILRKHYRLGCLSNTNAMHWERLIKLLSPPSYFDHIFASQLIGAAKPCSKCYLIALASMQVWPKDVWFFDDTLANVEAAEALGIRSFHIDPGAGVIPKLIELELLKSSDLGSISTNFA